MFSYDHNELKALFSDVLKHNISEQAFTWLTEKSASLSSNSHFSTTFVMLPRKTGKRPVQISPPQLQRLSHIRKGMDITGWTADRLARAWLILHLDASDKENYFRTIETLFLAAEVNELVALYSSLPLFAYPEMWTARCAEGIRNNIGDVLTAIMCNNPYPSEQLNEAAWNQMVLKAFFTEKPIDEIVGLDKRANYALARTLSDYAHERWAAHREVNPQLWRCVGPFIDQYILGDIKKLLSSGNELERKAAALAIDSSKFPEAKSLLPLEYEQNIRNGALTWNSVSGKTNDYVLQQ